MIISIDPEISNDANVEKNILKANID